MRRRASVNTAIFSIATGFSRIAGLAREMIAAGLFGTSPAMSAFTIANQIPALMTNLFAQAALSAAFVPVFTELLQKGKRQEAFRLATSLFWIVLVVLAAITAIGMLLAGLILPMFTGGGFLGSLAATLTQIMFPVVLLLGVTGVLVGVLQSYDEFSIPAIAPVVWNLVIIAVMLALHSHFGHRGIYAYAIAWLAATVVQFVLIAGALRRIDYRLSFHLDWQDPRIRRVFKLMLPVTLGLGIVNFDALINSIFGAFVNSNGPAAIRLAFVVYMLPQGMFSVAVATVLFPRLSRQAARRSPQEMRQTLGNGMRQINLLLIPAAAGLMMLATPITRLVFDHSVQFTALSLHLTSTALFWFAWSLPFAGTNLLLTRTFYALQRPWIPTKLAVINMAVDIVLSLALYKPLGIPGLIIGTAVANIVMTYLQLHRLRIGFNGRLELAQTTMITARILVAAIITGALAKGVWTVLNGLVGISTAGQLVSVGGAVAVAGGFYAWAVLKMRIPEAHQISGLILGRFRPGNV